MTRTSFALPFKLNEKLIEPQQKSRMIATLCCNEFKCECHETLRHLLHKHAVNEGFQNGWLGVRLVPASFKYTLLLRFVVFGGVLRNTSSNITRIPDYVWKCCRCFFILLNIVSSISSSLFLPLQNYALEKFCNIFLFWFTPSKDDASPKCPLFGWLANIFHSCARQFCK